MSMTPTIIAPVGRQVQAPTPIIVIGLPVINPGGNAVPPGGTPAPDPVAAQLVTWTEEQNKAKKYVVEAKEFDDCKTNKYCEERDYSYLTICAFGRVTNSNVSRARPIFFNQF